MSAEPPVEFTRLTVADIPLISRLLMAVWPRVYGYFRHPIFSHDYLRWLYGGPREEKHILIGAWMGSELVAYQCFLRRTVSCYGRTFGAYLNTHAAILPDLSHRLRMHYGFQIINQHVLFNKSSQFYADDCELVYAFYDTEKATAAILDRQLKKNFGIQRKTVSAFNHFVIMPNKLKKYLEETGNAKNCFEVRAASHEESSKLTKLFNEETNRPAFSVTMAEDELRHHLFGRSNHHTYVIEERGSLKGLINFYPLETVKENKIATHVLVEYLVSESQKKEHVAELLRKALDFGEHIGAKSVVFENANYLDYSINQSVGMVPTLRKMTLSAISKSGPLDYSGAFRCDVK